MCCVNNEAVLKALFKIKSDELTFTRAVEVATETEDAAKVARETVQGTENSDPKFKVQKATNKSGSQPKSTGTDNPSRKCYRCGNKNYIAPECQFTKPVCNYCKWTGHLEKVCRLKMQERGKFAKPEKCIRPVLKMNASSAKSLPKLEISLEMRVPC